MGGFITDLPPVIVPHFKLVLPLPADKNPRSQVKPPKVVMTFHFFSKDEISKLIENADESLRTAIIIFVNTGLRRDELFLLRWRDVDLKAKKLRVSPYEGFVPKRRRPRGIPLKKTVIGILKGLRKQDRDDDYVFRPFNSMYPLCERSKTLLKQMRFNGRVHDLKHTFASHLAMAGVPIPVISELLGHMDITTTMIYAHLAPDQHSAAVEKLQF